ncbi:hypothetical protein [Paraburkholderia sp.]|uniref:hypothetical protein n=1 Tax=Paraburkholderia sp. TaxID=1926495 RepID=UPI0039E2A7B8
MKSSKQWFVLTALLAAVATQPVLAAASDVSPQTAASPDVAPQCDSVSFATGSPRNRAACRRIFAREARPTVQTSPLTASDFGS